jgi:hypothetical protein
MLNHRLKITLDQLFEGKEGLNYEGMPVTFNRNEKKDIQFDLSRMHIPTIPEEYLEFLNNYGGCTLFKYDDLGGFEFLDINDIIKETKFQESNLDSDWNKKIIVFCRIICDGDFLCFKKNSIENYEILDGFHEEIPKNWKVINNSFSDFLIKLIETKGKRYWIESLDV